VAVVPYPVNDAEFAARLLKKPRWWNGEALPSRFIDTWDV
jgi:hypothetical protein